MDFDDLLVRFFGTADIDTLDAERLVKGVELTRMQFGLERDSDRRFALWCLLYMLGVAPEVEDAFQGEEDRAAAREFMEEADAEMDGD
jgi:hypothetical protein